MPSNTVKQSVQSINNSQADALAKLYIYAAILNKAVVAKHRMVRFKSLMPIKKRELLNDISLDLGGVKAKHVDTLINALSVRKEPPSLIGDVETYFGYGYFNDLVYVVKQMKDLVTSLPKPQSDGNKAVYSYLAHKHHDLCFIRDYISACMVVLEDSQQSIKVIGNGAMSGLAVLGGLISLAIAGAGIGAIICSVPLMAIGTYFIYQAAEELMASEQRCNQLLKATDTRAIVRKRGQEYSRLSKNRLVFFEAITTPLEAVLESISEPVAC